MKKKILLCLLVLFIGFFLGGITYYIISERVSPPKRTYYSPPDISKRVGDTSKAFSEVVDVVSPAVINISTTKTVKREAPSFLDDSFFDFFNPFHKSPRKWKEQSLGSGVVVSDDGYIVTNNHVIEHADEIKVTLYDRRVFKAKIVGVDPKTDIALIKINDKNLPTIPWGNSDNLKVGEFVLAIGNPFGLSNTVTMGIVSAVGRANVGIADYEDFIQTDAAINPGNSGGPLVNVHGELVGINTAIFSRSGGYQGIGFAVPSNMVRLVMEQLLKKGKVTRGWLGVTIQDLTPELAGTFGLSKTAGALVSDVFKGSPAQKAGIKRGDIIVELNGREVRSVSMLRNQVAQSKVGSEVELKYVRDKEKKRVKVLIAELPGEFTEVSSSAPEEDGNKGGLTGLSVTELTPAIARQLGVNANEGGVVVMEVDEGSPAREAGIKKGDIIQEVDRHKIRTYEDWKVAISRIGNTEMLVVFINRGGRRFYVAVKP
ncbi:MAG TPA: DegQ family serine endoprotease [Nitrospirae bacterium]|nr:putative periplasmic serine endoprotease DegP-like precursor [bacterium BMS3Abin08]HDY72217.1 DegQ family serine endoprotease [Nitrospirota bacterium]